jgi:uncharacterized protein (UPF0548 family)
MSSREIEQFRPQLMSRPLLQIEESSSFAPQSKNLPSDHSVNPAALDGSQSSEHFKFQPSEEDASRRLADHRLSPDGFATHDSADRPFVTRGSVPHAEVCQDLASGESVPSGPVYGGSVPRRSLLARLIRGTRLLGVPLVWAGLVAFCGGTVYSTYGWLISPTPVPNCDRIWFFSLPSDKLFCAEQQVRSGDEAALLAGLNLVNGWSPNHYLHKKASQLQRDWSKTLLALARQKALHNDLAGAMKLAREIAPGNAVYRDAKNAVLEWQKNQTQIQGVETAIEAALQTQQWQRAEEQIKTVQSYPTDYWRRQVSRLRERIVTERVAHNQLQQLHELVKANSATDAATLGRAINLAMQIIPNRYTRIPVQQARERWNQSLVQLAEQKLKQQDLAGAIAVAQWIPFQPSLPSAVRDLIWFNRARQVMNRPFATVPTAYIFWELKSILAALREISPNSPFYAQSLAYGNQFEPRVQDLTQLELAKATATLQQIPSLKLAIKMASTVAPGRPYRVYGQTLIATWKKDIQRAEDQPYLFAARQLAKTGKVRDLEAAIAQAGRIGLGRALRPEAQAAIFDWKQAIQISEDKPLLHQARNMATQGNLWLAVERAERIAPGRALYPEAQATIQQWIAKIQLTEDQPILQKAENLANLGDLGGAIAVASQIAANRVLYFEAQAAIQRWSAKLEPSYKRSHSEATVSQESNSKHQSEQGFSRQDHGTDEEQTTH